MGCGGVVADPPADPCERVERVRVELEAMGCDVGEVLTPISESACGTIVQGIDTCVADAACSARPVGNGCSVTYADVWP